MSAMASGTKTGRWAAATATALLLGGLGAFVLAQASAGRPGSALRAPTELAWVLCEAALSGLAKPHAAQAIDTSRPRGTATVLSSHVLAAIPGKRVTTILLHMPPNAWTPRHVHAGPLTAYVISGAVRSRLEGATEIVVRDGETFFEPGGAAHALLENINGDHPSELFVQIIHDEGPQLTTYLD